MITTAAQTILRGRGGNLNSPPDAFWELLEQYRPELIGQAQSILGNREDAEDAVQETFIAASRDCQKLPEKGLGAWLRSVNRANAVDRLRGRRSDSRRIQRKAELLPEDTFTTGGFSRLELRDSLAHAVQALPEHLRAVIQLRFYEHLSYKEIAQRLQIPIGNVSWLLMDASAAMFARLKKHVPAEGAAPQKIDEGETQNHPSVGEQ